MYVCCHSTLLSQNFTPSGCVREPVKCHHPKINLVFVVLFTHFQKTHHLFMTLSTLTFSPGDDIIHLRGNSSPEVVISRVVRFRPHFCLLLVKPPKLPTAEQVGFAIVGPDKGRLHPVHRHPVFSRHAPIGERPRVSRHGLCVLEDPILRSLTESVREN